jgi:DNA-binding NtrC family response regulator
VAHAAVVAVPVAVGAVAAVGPTNGRFAYGESELSETDGAASAADEGGGSLATVAKAASLKAERTAIEQTLRQVHWNRRKAAVNLGVSYKTLLNKIKECGISRV